LHAERTPDDPLSSLAERDPTIARVAETSLRMMAGAVSPSTLRAARALAEGSPSYPWEDVVGLVLRDATDPSALVQRGLEAQRDWLARGGAEPIAPTRRRRTLKTRAKGALAALLVRGVFYLVIAVLFAVLLVLLRYRFPWLDIYAIGEQVREAVLSVLR